MLLVKKEKLLLWSPKRNKKFRGWSWEVVDVTLEDDIVDFEYHIWRGDKSVFIAYSISKDDPDLRDITKEEMAEYLINEYEADLYWGELLDDFEE